MFYSRPKIEPLGWDLVNLPTQSRDSAKHFDCVTSDMRPVDLRFSGGWITVERGAANAPPDSGAMEEILSVPISPFGTMDIHPEQLCDILGLTVNGRKIDPTGLNELARGFDWSGRTTYWESMHLMKHREDPELFIRKASSLFPGSVLVQPAWEQSAIRLTVRQIKFLRSSDESVTIGVGFNRPRLERMLDAEEVSTAEYESLFAYSVVFTRRDYSYEDITGKKSLDAWGGDKLDLNYSVVPHRRYTIQTQYQTADHEAQSRTRSLLALMDSYFSRGFRIVNLKTGAVIREDFSDEYDTKSYSNSLRDNCLERPRQYLSVGVSNKPDDGATVDNPVFFAARPVGDRA
jgi:hypothetical protein